MHTLTGVLRQPAALPVRRHLPSATIGWIALTIMILAGSTTNAFGKQLTEFFSPLSMIFLSEVMLLLFAVLTFGFFPILKKLKRVRSSLVLPLVTAGVLNGIVAPVFWFTGLERTFAVNAQLFGNAETLFLILFGILLTHSFPKKAEWLGGGVILLGLLTVALHGFTEAVRIASGDLLIVLSGGIFALGGVIIRKFLRSLEPQIIIVARSSCSIAFFFLLSPFITHPFASEIATFPLAFLGVLIGYGLISRFLLIFSYYETLERLRLSTVSLLGTITVGTGLLFSHWYLGETVVWYQVTGAALIILGAVVVQWGSIKKIETHLLHALKAHHH